MLPPSLEATFWFTILTFTLIQVSLIILTQGDPDVVMRYVTAYGFAIKFVNLISFIPFVFAVVHAIVFLVSTSSSWNVAAATMIAIVSVLVIVSLLHLQSLAAEKNLIRTILIQAIPPSEQRES